MKRIRYGWRRDTVDYRDKKYVVPRGLAVPRRVDMRGLCSPVEDQADLGSCTAQALVGALEFLEIKNKIPNFTDLSRLFVYYEERREEGDIEADAGAQLRTGAKVLNRVGVCAESIWPYDIRSYKVTPPKEAYAVARHHRISDYQRLYNREQMISCIASGYPVVFGFLVFPSMHDGKCAETGEMPMPNLGSEEPLGGHAVAAVGYDLDKEYFIVRNSWGVEWGDRGYFYMPFGIIDNELAADFWTIRN